MIFLLDTNVLSEVRRPVPDRVVLDWLHRLDEDRAFVSVISLAEIRRGIALMESGRRREALAEWLVRDLPDRFAGRILAIDQKTAFAWGDLMAQAKRRGIGLSSMDGLLAATASAHGLTLATRNTKDFRDLGVTLFDPWGN
ncbi:MAG TPA: type II toxin-antitoxin system VapC family toxin [Roseiarcus sp.]|nr:type II toxin-antitoxin system VapC family toxin [Roseiarcus sp.]